MTRRFPCCRILNSFYSARSIITHCSSFATYPPRRTLSITFASSVESAFVVAVSGIPDNMEQSKGSHRCIIVGCLHLHQCLISKRAWSARERETKMRRKNDEARGYIPGREGECWSRGNETERDKRVRLRGTGAGCTNTDARCRAHTARAHVVGRTPVNYCVAFYQYASSEPCHS